MGGGGRGGGNTNSSRLRSGARSAKEVLLWSGKREGHTLFFYGQGLSVHLRLRY